jgi:hypothetical protein
MSVFASLLLIYTLFSRTCTLLESCAVSVRARTHDEPLGKLERKSAAVLGNRAKSSLRVLTHAVKEATIARHTPARVSNLSRSFIADSHLCYQGTDTVHDTYTRRVALTQVSNCNSLLPLSAGIHLRGPPLDFNREHPLISFAANEKTP